MGHHCLRTIATLAVSAALGLSSVSAVAAAPRPAPVSGLKATITHDSAYVITAEWDALPGATRYGVKVSGSGTRLSTGTVTAPTWTAETTLPAGTTVSVTVTPYEGRRKGKAATVSKTLPDVTAPRGSYSVHRDNSDPTSGAVSIHRDALSDDLTPSSQLTQTIAWDRGQVPVPWPSDQSELSHNYGSTEAVYHPVVTVQDAAHNVTQYEFAVAVRDTQAPEASYSVSTGSAFAQWTQIGLTELDIDDNVSADEAIVRTVDWGDGTVQTWTPALRHLYTDPGAYLPRVQLRDEAGNATSWLSTSIVEVTADTTAPETTLRMPRTALTHVTAWSTLRGRIDDGQGVGAKAATIKVAELRHGTWYGYRAANATWIKTSSKRAALRMATGTTTPTPTRRWTLPVSGLRKGTLVIKYCGADYLNNRSPWLAHQQRITT